MKGFLNGLVVFLGIIPMILLLASYYGIHVDPLESRVFPLLAYGFPYIVLLNLVSGLFLLLLKRWKWGLLNFALLIFGYNYITRIYSFGNQQEIQAGDLKILTYNVRAFDTGERFGIPRSQIRDSIFEFLDLQDASIYCFQEFYHEKNKKNFVQLADVFKATNTKYYMSSELDSGERFRYTGAYIFSKLPIINKGQVEITTSHEREGKCIFADIQVNDSTIIRVYNFHLASIRYREDEYVFVENLNHQTNINDENKDTGIRVIKMFLDASKRRSVELKFILNHAKKSPYPTVLCGDLNDTPSSFAYHEFRGLFEDAHQQAGSGFGKTYSGRMPANRIDYIFHTSHFSAQNFAIQNEVLSDHRAISTHLRLEE
jgi:endonuclease/exonuclease/phosphatase family metal-dependent hydrolase